MNPRADQQTLLNDVLAESAPPDFRAALLGESLRAVRRRRRWRQTRRAGVFAAVILVTWLVWPHRAGKISRPEFAAKNEAAKSYTLIETRALPAGAVVATGKFSPVPTVSSTAAVAEIATAGGGYRLINDAQLLALLGPRPVALVRTGPDSEELVFANPEDQRSLSGN